MRHSVAASLAQSVGIEMSSEELTTYVREMYPLVFSALEVGDEVVFNETNVLASWNGKELIPFSLVI